MVNLSEKNINNIDTKLINTLGDKYDSFKHYTSEIFAEVDKNATQFVSDGLELFAIAGASKVVFSTVEAGVVGATKITKKVDLQGSKKSDILDNLHKRADVPDHDAQSYSASKQIASDLQMNEPGHIIAGPGSNTIFRNAAQKLKDMAGALKTMLRKLAQDTLVRIVP